MATRSSKQSTPARPKPDGASGTISDAVVAALEALRDEIAALRDEVRLLGQRRASKRASGTRDPGDAVPPGVAVQEPAPLTSDDRRAKRKLERLGRD